jgi:chemotaxis response regulator CheB
MNKLRILVVDDDAIVGMLLAEMLEQMGHDVCAIEMNAVDAVNAAARCTPDLVIIDVRLGAGSGISAVREILRAGPVAHVFVSGDLSEIKTRRPGTVTLRKPYHEEDLANAIQRALVANINARRCSL